MQTLLWPTQEEVSLPQHGSYLLLRTHQALLSLGPLWGCHSKSHRGSSQPFQKPGNRGGHSLDPISLKYNLIVFGDLGFVFVLHTKFLLMIFVNNTFCLKREFGNNCLICKSEKQFRQSRAIQVLSRNIRTTLSFIIPPHNYLQTKSNWK